MTRAESNSRAGGGFHDDAAAVAASYFRGVRPESIATGAGTERARRILRQHLALAATRAPRTANVCVYRPGADSVLGVAIQIVNDDMPMLVDSVTAALRRLGATITEVIHPILDVARDESGRLRAIEPQHHTVASRTAGGAAFAAESWMHVQLADDVGLAILDEAERMLPHLLTDLRRVAQDTPAMDSTLAAVAAELAMAADDPADLRYAEMVRWLAAGHFTILGYARYHDGGRADDGLGILRPESAAYVSVPERGDREPIVRVVHGSAAAPISGAPYHCVIGIVDSAVPGGSAALGEHVFVGTFTVAGLHENILDIPLVAERVRQVIEWADLEFNSFSGQAMLEVLQSFPRVELFASDPRQLFETLSAVMTLNLRRQVRAFLRADQVGGAIYCLVFLPRDRYTTEVRVRMQELLCAEFAAAHIGYSARVTESELAVVYFTVQLAPGVLPIEVSEPDRARIQEELFAATRTWGDRLVAEIAAAASAARRPAIDYLAAFPADYQQDHQPGQAFADLLRLEALGGGELDVTLHRVAGAPAGEWRFTLYVVGAGVSLSRVLPLLHSLGVEVVDERACRVALAVGCAAWIYEFRIRVPAAGVNLNDIVRQHFCDAISAMWFGRIDIDRLNELVLRAGLSAWQIVVLRTYAKYLRQVGFPYSIAKITRVLLEHSGIARSYVELFEAHFDPDAPDTARVAALTEELREHVDQVLSLDVDRILRALLGLISSTLRTNYFCLDAAGNPRQCLSVKLDAAAISELPHPRPRFEIYVYSPRVEAVHLRFGAIARGGLRWSDRTEDFRTEILGLVKAQAVKNAVIVPAGAKGGFVVKQQLERIGRVDVDRQAHLDEGVACYRMFISGLLDLTDNVDHRTGRVLPPDRVVRRDGDDTYLVVAADKGTATFSDIANDVALHYGFWLGDAFASGGSLGYDHKAMGITARGAWKSVEQHFAELEIDTRTTDFTVIGIGDLSGDVFGNGMLLAEHIRLIAAFDHRHIFLDPNPETARSFAERRRVFELPRSSWRDYNPELISAGGGVFDRSAKAIPVSPEVRTALGLDNTTTRLSPPEMIAAILTAPADLLWNGGIGTYIKASSETHADIGDKSNDNVRVNADRLRVRVIGEGGNLGISSLGRVEFSLGGGRVNTDALDNAAGVDCSDHEVNLKILLDTAMSNGDLAPAERDLLLATMTGEVAELVLAKSIAQNRRLGLCRAEAVAARSTHGRVLADLELRHGVDRQLEGLPSAAELDRRAELGHGFTSPELANLMAHVKLALKADLLASELPEDPDLATVLPEYFPAGVRTRFLAAIRRHRLRREITTTMVVNDVIDNAGVSYPFRLAEQTGSTGDDAVRAYWAAVAIFGLRPLWAEVRTRAMPMAARSALEFEIGRALERSARWLLLNGAQPLEIGACVERYQSGVHRLAEAADEWQPADLRTDLPARADECVRAGAPPDVTARVFGLVRLVPLLDVLDLARDRGRSPAEVAALYYALRHHLHIDRLLGAVDELEHGERWRALARLAVRDDLNDSMRLLTLEVLIASEPGCAAAVAIAEWESRNRGPLARTDGALEEVLTTPEPGLESLAVAARQIHDVVHGRRRS
ncbi:NAD-glutamate dehydrogenase [Nocardia brasiliensis]|uniref:NAD-glutamate dehydrogenase n=1 Tax=Nocardia brasiliensis TaxID=37326 RepID=UPI002456BAEF|nr:NAD-glutamate dehydrogenase [Nocardia brasiliensis]